MSSACGSDKEETAPQATESLSAATLEQQPETVQPLDEQLTEARDGVIEVRTEGSLFIPNRLAAKVGEAVTLRITNADSQPHNLRIAGLDGQYETEDDALAEPASIAPGESGEMIFAPVVAGAYTFRCDFHPGSMGGQIVVSAP